MYVKKNKDTGINLSANEFKQKALQQTTEEVKNFKTLYPVLAGKVCHKKIVGQIMPFFKPLTKGKGSRHYDCAPGILS